MLHWRKQCESIAFFVCLARSRDSTEFTLSLSKGYAPQKKQGI